MLFNSGIFVAFFLGMYLLYWLVIKKHRLWLLLLSGCVFYASWDWRFLILLFFTSGVDFFSAKKIFQSTDYSTRKRWLIISIAINLLILGFFKYYNFFVSSFVDLVSVIGFRPDFTVLKVILPVGISFYTFQSIAYVTDVYRRKTAPESSALRYFTFICFFPQMVAGPIERAKQLLPQFRQQKKWKRYYFESGINLLAYGYFKKVVIADNLSVVADHIHSNVPSQSSWTLFIGVLAFAIQIYADFSGYTDIARGCAQLLGFKLTRNFYFPYFSGSFRQFWQRWHMSLSSWFRDYVYISLGGNRGSRFRRNMNLMVTFLISGLWHGANITFLLWGFLHGMALIIEKTFSKIKWPKLLRQMLVFLLAAYFFTVFRSPNITHFINYSRQLFSFVAAPTVPLTNFLESRYFFFIPFAVFLAVEVFRSRQKSFAAFKYNYIINLLVFALILLFAVFENAPGFIYFQF